jgi:23S rRNA (uridine2552-2'-O)-methyltransferase
MSERWYKEHQRDPWRKQAKSKGYRARSAFKLKQIQQRFQLIREGDFVLDVGCHPGGWTQVAVETTGPEGMVIGVDLEACAPIEGAALVIGDIAEDPTQQRICEMLANAILVNGEQLAEDNERMFNTIVSDISPSLTGQYERDQAISMELVAMVFDFTLPLLSPGGAFVTKMFQGRGIEGIVNAAKSRFSRVQRFSPDASRNSSSEVFLVCRNKLPSPRQVARGKSVQQQLVDWLADAGVVTDASESDDEEEGVSGFRRISRKDKSDS